jgi:hypothetical protein
VREKIEAGQHTTRLQIGARMMAKNNLLGDRVVVGPQLHRSKKNRHRQPYFALAYDLIPPSKFPEQEYFDYFCLL